MPLGKILRGLLASPDYSRKDIKALVLNGYRKNRSLLRGMPHLDLSGTLGRVRTPYLILQGDTDIVTSTKEIAAFVEASDNSHLRFRLVRHSGHIPGAKEMDEVMEAALGFFEAT
ncbi:MAG: hypothetical protein VB099_03125 [Candidatus Limiplasma sp.]|nr:hypothetical protein [Candidatus Limiplasma sp.]